jgi:beta-N-acetylhexosaminidase
MSMYAISRNFPDEKAAVAAVKAGVDFVLHAPDDDVAFNGIKAAVQSGEISEQQVTQSVERILRVKARLGLHRNRQADIAAIDTKVGTRANAAVADEICSKAITLVKDEKNQVPLALPKAAKVLYLSVIDYASGWREGAPSRAFIPALKARWPDTSAIEITDRTTPDEMDLVRELARRSDAVVVGTFVRIASYSGRMDLSASQIALLEFLATLDKPVVAVAFGNPYSVSAIAKMPAILVTYEFIDSMEVAAVQAIAGEKPIGGKLPITLPDLFPFGHGLTRPARRGSSQQ